MICIGHLPQECSTLWSTQNGFLWLKTCKIQGIIVWWHLPSIRSNPIAFSYMYFLFFSENLDSSFPASYWKMQKILSLNLIYAFRTSSFPPLTVILKRSWWMCNLHPWIAGLFVPLIIILNFWTSWTILQVVDLPTPNKWPIVLNSQGVESLKIVIATHFSSGIGLQLFFGL